MRRDTLLCAPPLAALCSLATAGAAPQPVWEMSFYAGGPPSVNDSVIGADGAAYVTGTRTVGAGPGQTDLAVIKFAPDGTVAWETDFAGPIGQDTSAGIALTDDGAFVYALGRSSVPGFGNSDYAIVKLDATTGAIAWSVFYDGGDLGIDNPMDIAAMPDGGAVATGGIDTADEQRDFGTVRFDAEGNELWERRFSGFGAFLFENDDARFVKVDDNGDVIITGNATAGPTNIRTIKYDGLTGATLWETEYETSADDAVRGLALAQNGDAVVFGSDPFGTDRRWLLVRYDGRTGGEQWRVLVDPGFDEFFGGVSIGASGTIYATGGTDPDSDDSNNNRNAITIAVDGETGTVRWLNEFGDEGFGDREFAARAAERGDRVYVFGDTRSGSLVADPFESDAFVLELDAETGAQISLGLHDSSEPGTVRSESFYSGGSDGTDGTDATGSGGFVALGSVSATGGPVGIFAARFDFGAECVADLAAPIGVLDLADLQAFVRGFVAMDPIADLAPPAGVHDLADVQAFVSAFLAGCPWISP